MPKVCKDPALTNLIPTLCRPITFSSQREEACYAKDGFSLHYSCRSDNAIVIKWLGFRQQTGAIAAIGDETDSYLAETDFAQSFMLLYLDFPLLRLDICAAGMADEVNRSYAVTRGDFYLSALSGPYHPAKAPLVEEGLLNCMAYFFSFNEVKRLVMRFTPSDKAAKAVFLAVGFHSQKTLPDDMYGLRI